MDYLERLFNYLINLKNLRDYIQIIDYFTTLPNQDNRERFINYYKKNYIEKIPKLVLYGTLDWFIGSIIPSRLKQLKEDYSFAGNCRIVTVKGEGHGFDFPKLHFTGFGDVLSSYKPAKIIVEFLRQNL